MKKLSVSLLVVSSLMTLGVLAQDKKEEKKEIIIEKKEGGEKEKMVIEINGNNVTINGKPASAYTGKQKIVIDENDIVINGRSFSKNQGQNWVVKGKEKKALLGVVTEKDEKGAKVMEVSDESAAQKAGLAKGDIITSVNNKSIKTPEELAKAIGEKKPKEEVEVSYLRDGKMKKAKAVLGESSNDFAFNNEDFNFDFNFDGPQRFVMPKMPGTPGSPKMEWFGDNFPGLAIFGNDKPKYGMAIQDDEEGRGVMVTDVTTESNAAKGGLQKDDIITSVEGKKITNVDQLKEVLGDNSEKISLAFTVNRKGKTQTINIKVPRKLKTANL